MSRRFVRADILLQTTTVSTYSQATDQTPATAMVDRISGPGCQKDVNAMSIVNDHLSSGQYAALDQRIQAHWRWTCETCGGAGEIEGLDGDTEIAYTGCDCGQGTVPYLGIEDYAKRNGGEVVKRESRVATWESSRKTRKVYEPTIAYTTALDWFEREEGWRWDKLGTEHPYSAWVIGSDDFVDADSPAELYAAVFDELTEKELR